jgi:hypothetical protein
MLPTVVRFTNQLMFGLQLRTDVDIFPPIHSPVQLIESLIFLMACVNTIYDELTFSLINRVTVIELSLWDIQRLEVSKPISVFT